MKIYKIFSVFILLFCSVQAQDDFRYVSPKPNSVLVSLQTSIILRCSSSVDGNSVNPDLFYVEGSKSGIHRGNAVLSDDGQTIVFNPDSPFFENENVSVLLKTGIKTAHGNQLPDYSFSFTTMPESTQQISDSGESFQSVISRQGILPAPPIVINSLNDPSPGYIFLATWDRNVPLHKYANFLFVLDNTGKIIDSIRINGAPFDFKIQPNGRLSYGHGDYSGITPGNSNLMHYVMDDNFARVDSFQMKNGYMTDFHDFVLLPNGHAMMMSYHNVIYDMSKIAEGGKTDAQIVINVFQEQDAEKNVVFEWRDIDYIPITDTDLRLTDPRINPSTLNAFKLDDDGNLLFSFRNHSDVMKISRETGEILWRLGGLKNEFTFIGEHEENAPYYFARQHDIRRLPNGNISLFDNGEFHTPWYSRAAEYELDEVNKTATLVSERRYSPGNISAQAAGSAQRLSDGGWFVGYGILNPASEVKRNIVEYKADGSIAFELSLPANVIAYRASKEQWKELVKKPIAGNAEVLEGNTYSFNKNGTTTGVSIRYVKLTGDIYNGVVIQRIPYGPVKPEFITAAPVIYPVSILYSGAAVYSHTSEIHIELNAFPEIKQPEKTKIYTREYAGQGVFFELPTVYDAAANELIASTNKFGEIVFGRPDASQSSGIPVLIEPLNGKKILAGAPVLLKWGGQGLLQSFKIQIASDSLFNTTVVDTVTNDSFLSKSGFEKNRKYYWRVRANGSSGAGEWSSVWSFVPAGEFIMIVAPNGGEEFHTGSDVVIRWDTNISDSVKINLYDGNISSLLGKTFGTNMAFRWKLPQTLQAGSSYRIFITPYSFPEIADTSEGKFSVTVSTEIEGQTGIVPVSYNLFQNYPNPFNPVTKIKFGLPEAAFTKLIVYDLLGREVETIVNNWLSAGYHQVEFNGSSLSSGIYLYRLTTPNFNAVKKLLLMK